MPPHSSLELSKSSDELFGALFAHALFALSVHNSVSESLLMERRKLILCVVAFVAPFTW